MYFDRNNFLKFFNQEVFYAEEGQLIRYLFITNEFVFFLDLVVYEDIASFAFKNIKNSYTIFNISLENITKITCSETNLFFYKSKESEIDLSKPDYTVIVKPKVSIDWELDNFCNPLD